MKSIGRGVSYEVNGSKLVLEIDLKEEPLLSSSNKSLVIASSEGNKPIAIDGTICKLGLNFFTDNPDYVKPAA